MDNIRLIDANALLKEIEYWHDSLGGTMNPADWGIQNVLQSVMDYIIEAEDLDAVEVVRCRECKYYNRALRLCNNGLGMREFDFYCADGKTMDGGAEG